MPLPRELDFQADTRATPARMNQAMEYILARVRAVEALKPRVDSAIEDLRRFGIERVAEILTPIFTEAMQIQEELQAIRTAWNLEEYFDDNIAAAGAAAEEAAASLALATIKASLAVDAAVAAEGYKNTATGAAATSVAASGAAGDYANATLGYRDTASGHATTATTKAAEAAASAASINDAGLVHKANAETLTGKKTMGGGIVINGQDISNLSAAGKAMVEAATVAAQKTLLGINNITTAGFNLINAADLATQKTILGIGTSVPAAGAVGSCIIASSNDHAVGGTTPAAIGSTVAGSTLYVSNSAGPSSNVASLGASDATAMRLTIGASDNLGYSGAWEVRSRVTAGASSGNYRPLCLFVRIA